MRPGNLRVRVLLAVVGLPLLFALIFLLPYYRHLGLNVAAVAVTALGALELEALLAAKGTNRLRALAVLSALIPAAAYLEITGLIRPVWFHVVIVTLLSVGLLDLLRVPRGGDMSPLLQKAAGSFLLLIYPALFVSFVVRITGLPEATLALLFFFSLNFGNDIMAYLVGTFLGSRTRLGLPVSPNKSIAGFAAGLASSTGIALLFRRLLPGFFPVSYPVAAAFGLGIGLLTIAGDLIESAFKRSAGVKDSGFIIPGRGGVLDSVDSLLYSAPLFYFVFRGFSGYISQ